MPAASAPPPDFDPAAAYPEMGRLRAALTAPDWPEVRALVAAAPGPVARTMLTQYAATVPGAELFLPDVLARDADDAVAAAVLGGRLITMGWAVRSSAPAAYVSQEQFRTFRDFLVRAERVLIDATARHPADPALWSQRLLSARGLGFGLAEVRRRYDRLAEHDPHHLPAQGHLLQSLCPKWGGTWQQMHAFAHECMLAAPPGAPNAVLVVTGHLERWLADDAHLASPEVRTEIYEAAARSVWDPGFGNDHGWAGVRNTFAMAFSLLGDHRAAAGQFTELGRCASEHPWHFLGDPAEVFVTRRAQAYAKAGL
ncbi:hypothetical protein GCM10020358_83300 [Amorphoplanes nipponensis]|uniref:DUF4034 domain-containing protein n=1 Tax=Actinoplanes nipponensis TaxID=135950 RepID=A0A919MMX3_9ACTN|nr:hypothetical protein [Actinoplanes nipponensis]GIE47868.1 hypothetical protein Ani05nite_14020 [Actinoplanes nipponensis]